MVAASHWGTTPRQSIERESRRRGAAAVVSGCVALVTLGESPQDVDHELVLALGGPPARRVLAEGAAGRSWYWVRVWGARGLLWQWDDAATPAITVALHDAHWRVREMSCKVVARHGLGDLLAAVAELRETRHPGSGRRPRARWCG